MSERAQISEQETGFNSHTGWMVGEIVLVHQVLGQKIKDLRTQNEAKSPIGQKLAAEEIVRIAKQIQNCAAVVVAKTTEHVNRKPRVT